MGYLSWSGATDGPIESTWVGSTSKFISGCMMSLCGVSWAMPRRGSWDTQDFIVNICWIRYSSDSPRYHQTKLVIRVEALIKHACPHPSKCGLRLGPAVDASVIINYIMPTLLLSLCNMPILSNFQLVFSRVAVLS